MAYVTVPKDLTHVKSKVLFGLTKRQLVCFGGALLTGGPLYFLARNYLSNSAAALLMIFAMLPGLLLALFERHGQPLEVVIQQMIQCCFIRPKERPYQTNNACLSLFYMISGGNATRSKRLGFKNPNNILCRFTVPASAPFPVLSAECRPHSAL